MTEEERERWLAGRVTGYVWYCGDDVCDCTQPVIERLSPNMGAGFPWIHRDRLWEGTFCSGADGQETRDQNAELAEACARFGIQPEP